MALTSLFQIFFMNCSLCPLSVRSTLTKWRCSVEKKYLKKVLAGFSIAGLMTGGGLALPGPAAGGSG
jgi:radical SAM modification target selenobiotic family peptide